MIRNFEMGKSTRVAYGKKLEELGSKFENLVVLDADLSSSTQTHMFAKKFPDRFFNVGIAEANMVSMASSLACSGKVPFISSFACFLMCKGFDQLRMCVAYPNHNVKVAVTHSGISIGEDGPSQQSIEDIALATLLPNVTVLVPSDQFAASALVEIAYLTQGPVYLRLGRPNMPIIYNENSKFEIGGATLLEEGTDVSIFACGLMVSEALKACDMLKENNINAEVIDVYSIKPINSELILSSINKTKNAVVVEEHLAEGGLGSVISRLAAENNALVPMSFVNVNNTYAESGTPAELLEKYGFTAENIAEKTRNLLNK